MDTRRFPLFKDVQEPVLAGQGIAGIRGLFLQDHRALIRQPVPRIAFLRVSRVAPGTADGTALQPEKDRRRPREGAFPLQGPENLIDQKGCHQSALQQAWLPSVS